MVKKEISSVKNCLSEKLLCVLLIHLTEISHRVRSFLSVFC
ncbi:hypothetical protein CP02DC14_2250 [Chlamydia psittaci 02DC14]|nr:hypothetical protein CP02DC14_2250 [Chlamydia psittaci 02DC14]